MPAAVKSTAFVDLDGPILDVSLRYYHVYTNGITVLGGTPVDQKAFWSAKRHRCSDSSILEQSGLRDAADAYKALKLETIEAPSYLLYDKLQPHAPMILRQLADRYRLVLVTLRQSRDRLLQQLASLDISKYFDNVLSAAVGPKSGWETKRDLVYDAGIITDSGGLFVGDTETDILAGKALGVLTVAVCNGIRAESHLRALAPDWIIPTLADLPSTNLLL